MASKQVEIDKRRRKVKDLYFHYHLTAEEIVEAFEGKWSRRTIFSDLEVLRKEFGGLFSQRDKQEWKHRRMLSFEKIKRTLWRAHDEEQDSYKKAKIAEAIDARESAFITDLMKLGVLDIPKEEIHHVFAKSIEEGAREAMERSEELKKMAIASAKKREKEIEAMERKAKKKKS